MVSCDEHTNSKKMDSRILQIHLHLHVLQIHLHLHVISSIIQTHVHDLPSMKSINFKLFIFKTVKLQTISQYNQFNP